MKTLDIIASMTFRNLDGMSLPQRIQISEWMIKKSKEILWGVNFANRFTCRFQRPRKRRARKAGM